MVLAKSLDLATSRPVDMKRTSNVMVVARSFEPKDGELVSPCSYRVDR